MRIALNAPSCDPGSKASEAALYVRTSATVRQAVQLELTLPWTAGGERAVVVRAVRDVQPALWVGHLGAVLYVRRDADSHGARIQ